MTGRACYLSRSERGGRIVEARLVGQRTDESWSDGQFPPQEAAQRAAAWVADRMAQGKGGETLGVLCVDVDGAVCGWVTAPSADPTVVAAAVAAGATDAGGPLAGATRAEATLQGLSLPASGTGMARRLRPHKAPAEAGGVRLPVMLLPDVSARLFLDELDERGVGVDSVVSLWHALAMAWDPGGPAARADGGAREDRVVATAPQVCATALYDGSGRLAWAWSRAGELLTGGTMRLVAEGRENERTVRIAEADLGRLTADWLAWAAQLGVAPTRITVIGPRPEDTDGSLGPGALGQALTAAWPGAAADLIVVEDPIGATLQRLAGLEAMPATDPQARLVALTHRPSRAHRSLMRAAALALSAGALALIAVAWNAWHAAGVTRANAEALAFKSQESVAVAVPSAAESFFPERDLEAEVTRLRTAHEAPRDLKPAEPILEELETVSFVLSGIEGVEAEDYSFLDSAVSIRVTVPSTAAGEQVLQSLKEIEGSHCIWQGEFAPTSGNSGRLAYLLTGAWNTRGGAP